MASTKQRPPTTASTLKQLRAYESRNVTFVDPDGTWPIVWERAQGVHVWDISGKKYLDLTAAFGVSAAGHANPRVVRAGQKQMAHLLHAMGDVHPHALKARLARELSRVTFERWTGHTRGKTIFCNSGFEAVEAALKTAMLATGRKGIIAFEGAYHGLGYGALNATHRRHFRGPFLPQLGGFSHFVPFPEEEAESTRAKIRRTPRSMADLKRDLEQLFREQSIGAIVVEPLQVRGGINVPPPQFLRLLRSICDRHQALLIVDEIYTGFGRTGRWFACEHSRTVADLICLGKALTGGFPLSACVGRADLMDKAWPAAEGEAIHTSTFLGHPVGCAMALAQIEEIRRSRLVERSARLGSLLLSSLSSLARSFSSSNYKLRARGLGLLAGLEIRDKNGAPATQITLALIKNLLGDGFIFLPEGAHANIVSFSPPLTISERQLMSAVQALRGVFQKITR